MPPGWLLAAEAAPHLGQTARSIRRRCAAGLLTSIRVGNQWYVNPDAHPALKIAVGNFSTGPAAAGTHLANLSAVQRKQAFERLEMIKNFLQALEHKPASMTLGEFQARWVETFNALNPARRTSRTSLWRWLKAYQGKGVIGLVDRRGGYRKPAEFSPEAKEFCLGLYLSQHNPSIPYIYTIASGQAREHGWLLPGLRTVQRFLRERTDPKLIAAGRDPKRFRDRCIPHIKRDWTLVAAMEAWVADHRQFDVLIPRVTWNRQTRREEIHWYRPWLTMYLDCRSWMPVGWIIEFDSPDADRVMGAFANGVAACGAPEHGIMDNGKDFRAHDFAGGRIRKVRKGAKLLNVKHVTPMLEALGVQAHWAIPYNAKAKVVEPFFGIMAEQFDKLWPTYCGRSPDHKPEKLKGLRGGRVDLEKLNIDIFRRAFAKWVQIYSLAPSPAKAAGGRSPLRAIAELRQPGYQPIRPAAETLALLQTRSRRIRVEQNGVWVAAFQRHYFADELESRRAASGRDISRHVAYRYRPGSPDGVWVFDFRTDKFICYATPYVGDGVHPLASDEADRAQLAEAMAIQRGIARRTNAEVRRLKRSAAEVLLAAYADGLAARGALDDPKTIQAPAAPVIKLIGDGEMDRAAQAGRRKRETAGRRETASAFLSATGTTDERPPLGPGDMRRAADPLEALSADSCNSSDSRNSWNKESNHEQEETGDVA